MCLDRTRDGTHRLFEQDAIWEALHAQPEDNPLQMDLEAAITAMAHETEVRVTTD
jgi:hypothetical protein